MGFLIAVHYLDPAVRATELLRRWHVEVRRAPSVLRPIPEIIVNQEGGVSRIMAVNGEHVVGLGGIQNIVVLRSVEKETNVYNISIVLATLINIVV